MALVIVLDQFPRNMFRDDPRSFVTDAKALAAAEQAVALGFDRKVTTLQRTFFYLPYEHSENIETQKKSLELFTQAAVEMKNPQYLEHASKHYQIVERFGRFPHRNKIMGRLSTPEEEAFLKINPGF